MNNIYPYIQIYPLLLIFIFITPCNGQDKTNTLHNSPDKYRDESNTIPKVTSVNGNQPQNQNSEIPWVDPLFYIDGQLCQHVRRIFQDKSGNLWFGSNVYGLMRYNGDTLEYFSENDGLGIGRITGIVEDKEGNVWFGTYGGLSKYDTRLSVRSASDGNDDIRQAQLFTNFSEKDGLVNNEIWSLIIDSKGIFWIGTMEGVSRFDGEEFTTFPIPKARVKDTTSILSYNRVSCIMEDRNGIIWFGTDGFGICKYDARLNDEDGQGKTLSTGQAGFTHFTKEDGLCDNNITSIMEDKNGKVWIGTMYGGISRYDARLNDEVGQGKSFTNLTENGVVSGIEVWSIYEDKSGNIWFPAENFGVYRYDAHLDDEVNPEKSYTNFNTNDGLNTNGIQCIFEDEEGRFWFGGWGGLFRYDASLKDEVGQGESFFSVTKEGPWQ